MTTINEQADKEYSSKGITAVPRNDTNTECNLYISQYKALVEGIKSLEERVSVLEAEKV